MQLFSQLQSFIYFDNTRALGQLTNSYEKNYGNDLRLIIVDDFSKVLENNSIKEVHSNPISLLKEKAQTQTKETTTLLDSNKLDVKINEPMLIKDSLQKCRVCSRVCLNKLGLLNHMRIMHNTIKANKISRAKHSKKNNELKLKSLTSRMRR